MPVKLGVIIIVVAFFLDFFFMWTILKVLNLLQNCFFFMFWFLAPRHVVSKLPDQGSNLHSLHWKVKS